VDDNFKLNVHYLLSEFKILPDKKSDNNFYFNEADGYISIKHCEKQLGDPDSLCCFLVNLFFDKMEELDSEIKVYDELYEKCKSNSKDFDHSLQYFNKRDELDGGSYRYSSLPSKADHLSSVIYIRNKNGLLTYSNLMDYSNKFHKLEQQKSKIENKIKKLKKEISIYSWENYNLPSKSEKASQVIKSLVNYLYKKSDVKKFFTVKKLRHDQKARLEARKIAEKIWKKERDLTIEDMITREKIIGVTKKKNGKFYSEKTVRNWINELAPNRKPGRRPKKINKEK